MALEQVKAQFLTDGLEEVQSDEQIAMRSTEPNSLELNDIFIFPEGTGLYKDRVDRTSTTSPAFYVCIVQMCEIVNGRPQAVDKFRKFYISNMWKRRRVCDERGVGTGQSKCTGGNAAEAFRDYKTVQEALEGLKKRPIKVTKYEPVYTLSFTTHQPEIQYIPTFEFVQTPQQPQQQTLGTTL